MGDEMRETSPILTPNYYYLRRGEWVYAYIGMVDVSAKNS